MTACTVGSLPAGRGCRSAWTNKSVIVGRVAGRVGLNKSTPEGAVNTALEAIGEALAKDEAVRLVDFGTFATRSQSTRIERSRGGDASGGATARPRQQINMTDDGPGVTVVW